MSLSAFDDKAAPPQPERLAEVLGKAAPAWRRLIAAIAEDHPPVAEHWNFAGAKFGWSMRLKRGDRIVLYLTPQEGAFLAGVVLGDKAVRAVRAAGLPPAVIALIDEAPRHAEGTGIRMPVTKLADAEIVRRLVAAKMSS